VVKKKSMRAAAIDVANVAREEAVATYDVAGIVNACWKRRGGIGKINLREFTTTQQIPVARPISGDETSNDIALKVDPFRRSEDRARKIKACKVAFTVSEKPMSDAVRRSNLTPDHIPVVVDIVDLVNVRSGEVNRDVIAAVQSGA
jgi:hypothetical protein